jgi:hypothetical protein
VELILGASELSSSYVVCGRRKLFTNFKDSKKQTNTTAATTTAKKGFLLLKKTDTHHLIQEYM